MELKHLRGLLDHDPMAGAYGPSTLTTIKSLPAQEERQPSESQFKKPLLRVSIADGQVSENRLAVVPTEQQRGHAVHDWKALAPKIRELRTEGYSIRDIAGKLDLGQSGGIIRKVTSILAGEYKPKRKPKDKPSLAERRGWDEARVVELHNQGLNPNAILKELGRPRGQHYTVVSILHRHGLEPHCGKRRKEEAPPVETPVLESAAAPTFCPVAENPECVEIVQTERKPELIAMANPTPRAVPTPEERVAGCMEWLNGVKREIDTAHGLLQQFHEAYGFSAEAAQLADTLRIVTKNRLAALGVA